MGNTTIPMLPAVTGLLGPELIEIVQNGASARASLTQLAALVGSVSTTPVLTSALPSPVTSGAGNRRMVLDATSVVFASVLSGGGANTVPVYSDGTVWRIG